MNENPVALFNVRSVLHSVTATMHSASLATFAEVTPAMEMRPSPAQNSV